MESRRRDVAMLQFSTLLVVALLTAFHLPTIKISPLKHLNVTRPRLSELGNTSGGLIGWKPFFERTDKLGQPDKPRILFWTTISGWWGYSGLSENGTAELAYWTANPECTHRCYIANDRRTMAVSDAIVFYYSDLNASDVPTRRALGQKWVFWSLEPPTNFEMRPLLSWRTAINWTMTYRLDSDVLDTYGSVKRKAAPESYSIDHIRKIWMQKDIMAVWPVSHCNTFGQRENFVEELRKYVRVDVYGDCGNYTCQPRGSKCHEEFARKYFFYLSFENTVCKDYVTEKFYLTIQFDIIPVTFGGADYKSFAPPHSYIDALAFKTPKDLADYLKHVKRDFRLYRKYFAWKGLYDVKHWEYYTYCNLCAKLYSTSFKEQSVYPDIVHWWNNTSQCRAWNNHTMKLS
ncbi:alpha-(1,3)-fucosyltransferase C-like [Haemaphysalis longicornis]